MSNAFHEVAPNVYIGGWHAARDFAPSFDIVVNVAVDAPNFGGPHFHLVDGPGNPPELMREAVTCVEVAIRQGKRVLVHCVGGRSRSLTVVAEAIRRVHGTPLTTTIERMRLPRALEPHQPEVALLELLKTI